MDVAFTWIGWALLPTINPTLVTVVLLLTYSFSIQVMAIDSSINISIDFSDFFKNLRNKVSQFMVCLHY